MNHPDSIGSGPMESGWSMYQTNENLRIHRERVKRCRGRVDMSPGCGSKGPRFKSHCGTNVLWQDIDLHLPLSTQVLKGYPVG